MVHASAHTMSCTVGHGAHAGAKPTNFGGFHANAIPDTSPHSNLAITLSSGGLALVVTFDVLADVLAAKVLRKSNRWLSSFV